MIRSSRVSFAFNLWRGALQVSTLLWRRNDQEGDEVLDQFLRCTLAEDFPRLGSIFSS